MHNLNCDVNKLNETSSELEKINPQKDPWNLRSWFHKPPSVSNEIPKTSNDTLSFHKTIAIEDLIEKPIVTPPSKISDVTNTNYLQRLKLKRISSVKSEEIEKIYELKNYDYLKLGDIKEEKAFSIPKTENKENAVSNIFKKDLI